MINVINFRLKRRWSLYKGLLFAVMVIFLLFSSTVVGVASVYSKNTKLSLNVQSQSIKSVLQQIEAQSGFRFVYENERLNLDKRVSINVRNVTVDEILNQLFKDQSIHYSITEKNLILINPAERVQQVASEARSHAVPQEKNLRGRVTNAQGEPLTGVSVIVKGTTNGTVTDVDGEYTLSGIHSNKGIIVFSFIGMKTKEAPYTSQSVLNVTLENSAFGLQEVVAVGYGRMKKADLTGAVGTVSAQELQSRPVLNATQMLQGLVAGLNISQNGGMLNSSPSVNIRGVGTIGKGSDGSPLVLIDGMEGDMNTLNPQDIENISVLKDVSSSSIYGSRAPFGVILITTKKGKEGKTVVNYNDNFRWNNPTNMPEMMDSYTFANFFNDANVNSGAGLFFDTERLQRIKDYRDGKLKTPTLPYSGNPSVWSDGYGGGANANVDWYKAIYRSHSSSQEHNLSASGGNATTQYYLSGNYMGEDGLMVFNQDKYTRYTTSLKITTKLNDWATVTANNRWMRSDYGRPSALSDGLFQDLARQGWPTNPLYDNNGYLFSSPSPALGLRDGGRDKTQTDNLYQQYQIVLEPIKGWKTYGEVNYRTIDTFRHWDVQKTYNHDVNGVPYGYGNSSEVYEYGYRENYLKTNVYSEYDKKIGNGHHIKALVGFQSDLEKYRDLSADRQGVIVSSLSTINTTSGTDYYGNKVPPTVTGQYQTWSTEGLFGRINYDYKEKYLFEGNLRYDGTSRFRSDKSWNWFPSFSAGWNVAKEDFWQPYADVVGNFKIRTSYGRLGNQNTTGWYPTYSTMPIWTATGTWLINDSKQNISTSPGLISQAMTWERVKNWNIGTDLTLLKDRLSASFDYYTRKTVDMIGPAPKLPSTLGATEPSTNNTDLRTNGFELSVAWADHLDNGLNYSLRVNVSDSKTKILRYPNPTSSIDTNVASYYAGETLGDTWGYETVGIAKTKQEMDAHLATLPHGGQDAIGTQWDAGDIMYKDLNGDGKIDSGSKTLSDHGDLKVIGNSTPRYLFSFDLNADYKGFDFRSFFQGVLKRDYFQGSYYFWGASSSGIWWSTGLKQHEDYFRNDPNNALGLNLNSYYPRPLFGNGKNQQTQSRYLLNAAYIRLKNLQLGYTLPKSLTQQVNIQKLRIFVSGENLWTGTKLTKIFDPETIDGGNGSNGNAYPLFKVYSVGLSVNF